MNKLLLALSIVFSACNMPPKENKEQADKTIINLFSNSMKNVIIDSVFFIKLDTDNENLLGSNLKLIQNNENIFVGDFTAKHCIYRFDKNGKFLNKIGQQGKGPNEYPHFSDFIVRNNYVEILSNFGVKSKIFQYSHSGIYISSLEINIGANSFEKSSSNYLFSSSYNKHYKYRLHVTDFEGNEIKGYIANNKAIDIPITEWNLSKTKSSILYKEAFNNKVFTFNDGKLNISYEFNFGKYSIPKEFYNEPLLKGFSTINKRGFALIKNYFENKEIAAFEIIVQKENTPSKIHNVVFLKKDKSVYDYSFSENEKNIGFHNLIGITTNNELIYLEYPNLVIENFDYYKQMPNLNTTELITIKDYDNPIVFYCKINI